MKNKKNTTVKKIVMTAITVLILFVSLAFITKPNEQVNLNSISKASKDNTIQDYKYFVVLAFPDEHGKGNPIWVSNVIDVSDCSRRIDRYTVESQFSQFFKAYYHKYRLHPILASGCKTRSDAVARRREFIAKYDNVQLVTDFTVTCN